MFDDIFKTLPELRKIFVDNPGEVFSWLIGKAVSILALQITLRARFTNWRGL